LERFVARRDEPAFAALVARHGPMVLERITELANYAKRAYPYDKAVPTTLGEAEAARLEAEMLLEREKAK
jgi:hypothetical protein